MLSAASARFRTNGVAKDERTVVSVYVDGPWGRVAKAEAIGGHLGDHADNGPYALTILRSVDRAELPSCRTRVHIDPHDDHTWRFDYELALSFDDAPPFVKTWNGVALDRDNRDFSDGLL